MITSYSLALFIKEFVLQTDASDRGVDAVLSQMDDEGNDRPIAYYSHKLLPRQAKYSTVEKEYLMGQKFRILTDHRSLEWLNNVKDSNPRLTRWSLFLQSYWFDIEYRTGHRNGNADGLSRLH